MNHIADVGKMVETIEVSKLLSECADWHEFMANISVTEEAGKMHKEFSEAIRSIVIPSPGAPDERP